MEYATKEEVNGFGGRLNKIETAFSGCKGEKTAKIMNMEKGMERFGDAIGLLERGQSRIFGAIIAVNGFILILIGIASVALILKK